MKFCDQCGNKLKDNAKFCPACGTPVENDETPGNRTCAQCGAQIDDDAVFCDNCGTCYNAGSAQAKATLVVAENQSMRSVNQERIQYISEYISRAAALEKSLFTQDLTIEQLEIQIGNLGHSISYERPVEPDHASLDDADPQGIFSIAGFGAMIGGAIGLFAGSVLWGALIGGALLLGGICLGNAIENSNYNSAVDEQYRKNMNRYNAVVAEDEKRVKAEVEEAEKLYRILCEMQDARDETDSVLKSFYDANVIFPKYRNLIAVCSFDEYFETERCSDLPGAYNLYEQESRLDRICTKLDEVIENLEKIKASQYFLYEAIQKGNQISQQLLQESVRQSRLAEQTAENTALSAHYSEIAANNAEACAWIGVANYLSIEDSKRRLSD